MLIFYVLLWCIANVLIDDAIEATFLRTWNKTAKLYKEDTGLRFPHPVTALDWLVEEEPLNYSQTLKTSEVKTLENSPCTRSRGFSVH